MCFALGSSKREGPPASAGSHALATCFAAVVVLLLAAVPSAVRADDDLPGRVGRVADFAGQLYLSVQDRPDDWTPIEVNYPVTSGDNLWVSGDGRAEIDYGGGQFRLAGDTSLNVSRLDDLQLTLFVARGRLIVRVRVLDTGDAARVDTPNTQVALTRPGLYRIDVSPDGHGTTVAVREGEGLIALAYGVQQVLPGQAASVSGMEPLAADVRIGSGVDGFDTWSANRDRHYERGRAPAYVSPQMVGSADLGYFGTWEDDATYGPVWYPTAVAADWAPYRDGYWTAVGGWGLTWVDVAPWGYAPSHYGRWVRPGGRWGWCPGTYVRRPHWAPALVGWYGGAGWGLRANTGAPVYGWVPLGWGDAYRPWWRGCSHSCWSRYNRPYAVNPSDWTNASPSRYSHLADRAGATAVAGATLVGRKPVRSNMVPLPAPQLASAPLLATAPDVARGPNRVPIVRPGERGTPTPASVLYSRARHDPAFGAPKTGRPASTAADHSSRGRGAPPPGVPSAEAPRIRPAPATSARPPTAPAGAPLPLPMPMQAVSPSGGVAPTANAPSARKGIALPPTGIGLPSARTALPPTGIGLPSARTALPPTGIGLPSAGTAQPPTGMALPPPQTPLPSARAAPAPVPLPVPGVPPPGALVHPAPGMPPTRPPQPAPDTDAQRGGSPGERNPAGGQTPR